jgi:hypothetical protein
MQKGWVGISDGSLAAVMSLTYSMSLVIDIWDLRNRGQGKKGSQFYRDCHCNTVICDIKVGSAPRKFLRMVSDSPEALLGECP